MMAMKRMSMLAQHDHMSPEARKLNEDVYQFKQESEKEVLEDMDVIHHHNANEENHPNTQDGISVVNGSNGVGSDVTERFAAVNLATKSSGVKRV